jgi:sugar (pentulose or hexulose) kinase
VSPVAVGLDIGTTSIKGVVVEAGRSAVLAESRVLTPWRPVATGREMNPADLRLAVMTCLIESLSQLSGRQPVAAIGVTSFGQSGTLIDVHGEPLAPFVSWDDSRFDGLAAQLEQDLGAAFFAGVTGLAPAGCWSANHILDLKPVHRSAVCWMGVAEWIIFQLGGKPVSEISLASESGLLDVRAAQWSRDVAAWSHADGLLPELVASGTDLGHARDSGVVGAVLTVAGHDHAVGAHGAGALGLDVLYDSAGTSETLVRRMIDLPVFDIETLVLGQGLQVGRHITGDFKLSTSQRTSWALGRVLEDLGVGVPPTITSSTESASVERVMTGRPLWQAGVEPASVWLGSHGAVADRIAESAALLDSVCGSHEQTVLAGGWVADEAFVEARRSRLRRLTTSNVSHPGALGAALIAASAAGLGPTPSDTGCMAFE